MKKSKKIGNESEYYAVMFCPEGRGNPFTLRLHRRVIHVLAVAIFLIVLGIGALVYSATDIALKLQHVNTLTEENDRLREYNRNLEISADKISNIDSMTAYLRRIAEIADIDIAQTTPPATQPATPAAAATPTTPATPPPPIVAAAPDTARPVATTPPADDFAAAIPNIMPINGWITRRFDQGQQAATPQQPRPRGVHRGIDIAAAMGTPIRATAMGTVEDIRIDRYLGLLVEVRHDHGFLTRYGHTSQVLVSIGDRVSRGQTIALVGNTGRSTAPHVHYEVLRFGRYIDPMTLIGVNE